MKNLTTIVLIVLISVSSAAVATERDAVGRANSVYLYGNEIGGRGALNSVYSLSAGLTVYYSKSKFTQYVPSYQWASESRSVYLNLGVRRYGAIDERLRYFTEGILSPSQSVEKYDSGLPSRNTRTGSVVLSLFLGAEFFLMPRLSVETKVGISGYFGKRVESGELSASTSLFVDTSARSLIVNWYF